MIDIHGQIAVTFLDKRYYLTSQITSAVFSALYFCQNDHQRRGTFVILIQDYLKLPKKNRLFIDDLSSYIFDCLWGCFRRLLIMRWVRVKLCKATEIIKERHYTDVSHFVKTHTMSAIQKMSSIPYAWGTSPAYR